MTYLLTSISRLRLAGLPRLGFVSSRALSCVKPLPEPGSAQAFRARLARLDGFEPGPHITSWSGVRQHLAAAFDHFCQVSGQGVGRS